MYVGLLLVVLSQTGSCHGAGPKNSSTSNNAAQAKNSNDNQSSRQTEKQNMNKTPDQQAGETWGGDHVRLVMKQGGADLEFDCARGEITEALQPDAEGHFEVAGTFVREGGPVRLGGGPTARPAKYVGRIAGDSMTFQIHLTDPKQTTETFSLKRGAEGRLWKCR